MARGKVSVSPGMFETKVMVAPNSPNPRANDKSVPVMIPGIASGKVMVAKTQSCVPPSVRAADRPNSFDEPAMKLSKVCCGCSMRFHRPLLASACSSMPGRGSNATTWLSARGGSRRTLPPTEGGTSVSTIDIETGSVPSACKARSMRVT